MVLGDRGHDMQKEAMLPFVTGVMPLAAFDHLPRAPDMPCIFRSRLHSKFHLCANSSVVSARKWKVRLAHDTDAMDTRAQDAAKRWEKFSLMAHVQIEL